jgi:hypothetical protein
MSPPPTSIDATEITGATIDGQDVEEITVDGDVVFSAKNLPVAYSNLVAWYPFDSATYGGSNSDDVTAIFNPSQSGDSTAYDGTLINTPDYQSTGGVTDINAAANSGGYDFDGDSSGDKIELPFTNDLFNDGPQTICCWFNQDTQNDNEYRGIVSDKFFDGGLMIRRSGDNTGIYYSYMHRSQNEQFSARYLSFQEDANRWRFVAGTSDGTLNGTDIYMDDGNGNVVNETTDRITGGFVNNAFNIGGSVRANDQILNGQMDDVRFYDAVLSQSQLQQIYDNTEP